MGLNFTPGGMGIAFQGARAGQQDELSREEHAQDRDYLTSTRDFEQGQRQRALDAQTREDELRQGLSAVAPAGVVPPAQAADGGTAAATDALNYGAVNGSDAGFDVTAPEPKLKMRTQDQELRDISALYRKAGDIKKAVELGDAADKIAFGRATSQWQTIAAGSDGMSTADLARRFAKIYDADPTSGGVKSIEEIPDGVRLTIYDRNSGATDTREFKGDAGKKQLLDEMHSYYAPGSWAAIQQKNAESRIKLQEKAAEEAAKSHIVPGGATLVRPDNAQVHVPREFNPAAGAHGKEPKSALEQARGVLESIAEKSEDKLTTNQRAMAEDYLGRVVQNNPGIPPERAAQVAVGAATAPTSVVPSVNKQTGSIDSVYKSADGSAYTLVPNVVTADGLAQAGIKPEAIKRDVGAMLVAQGDATVQRQLSAAAFDPKAYADLIGSAKSAVDAAVQQALQKNRALPSPLPDEQVMASAQSKLAALTANIDRKLALIRYAYTPDELGVGPAKPAKRPWAAGGLIGNQNAQSEMVDAGSVQLP